MVDISTQKKNGILYTLSKLFIENIFLLYVIWGILHMFGYHSLEGGMVKVVTLIVFLYIKDLKWKPIDYIVLLYISYCLLTYVWGDVNADIYIDGIYTQILPVSLYFIARINKFRNARLFEKMSLPLLFSFLSGLYLFIVSPSWYMDYRMQNWTGDAVGDKYYELTRLSGFWEWPYFIGTASLFFLMYEIYTQNLRKYSNILYVVSVIIGLITMIFAQLRVSIAYFFVFLLFYLWDKRRQQSTRKIILVILVLVFVGGIITIYVLNNYLDEGFVDYILNRTINKDDNMVVERVKMFDDYVPTISFLGSGLGGFSHHAYSVGKHSIADCDYLRVANEVGVVGISLLFLIILIIFLMGLKKCQINFFELNIHLYLLFAMIGSAPLEHLPLHPYMYWYCMGRIVTNSYTKKVISECLTNEH